MIATDISPEPNTAAAPKDSPFAMIGDVWDLRFYLAPPNRIRAFVTELFKLLRAGFTQSRCGGGPGRELRADRDVMPPEQIQHLYFQVKIFWLALTVADKNGFGKEEDILQIVRSFRLVPDPDGFTPSPLARDRPGIESEILRIWETLGIRDLDLGQPLQKEGFPRMVSLSSQLRLNEPEITRGGRFRLLEEDQD